jgi:hypothetical protein
MVIDYLFPSLSFPLIRKEIKLFYVVYVILYIIIIYIISKIYSNVGKQVRN